MAGLIVWWVGGWVVGLVGWLAGWLAGWQVGWCGCWLVGWLSDYLHLKGFGFDAIMILLLGLVSSSLSLLRMF